MDRKSMDNEDIHEPKEKQDAVMGQSRMTGFYSLPSELVVRILCYLDDLQDVLSASLVAREVRACTLENPIWHNIYHARWRYSQRDLDNHAEQATIPTAGSSSSSSTTAHPHHWRTEYQRRHTLDTHLDDTVHKLIHPPLPPNHARIPRYRDLHRWGLDVKDRLLQHMHCPASAPDVLARRYWARSLLTALYRWQAVATWRALAAAADQDDVGGSGVSLEQAVCAFEHFVSGDDGEVGDYAATARRLDEMARDFCETQPEYSGMGARGRALLLAHYMINLQGFDGTREDTRHDICNNFIGMTMASPSREGLPINYAVIYCALAKRIGLDAQPCNFPRHVYVVVSPPLGCDLNGKKVKNLSAAPPKDRMYLDLYALNGLEVSESSLRASLSSIPGLRPDEHESCLEPARPLSMVVRVRANLMYSVQKAAEENEGFGHWRSDNQRFYNKHSEDVMYAIIWMTIMLTGEDEQGLERRRSSLAYLMQPLERSYPGDYYLCEEMVSYKFRGTVEERTLSSELRSMRYSDQSVPEPKCRNAESYESPHYKIGTCFVHRRYGYNGMIVGWDPVCRAPEVWQRQQRINELDNGRLQCFYNIVSSDGADRYVAQENIGPTPSDAPDENLLRMAGRYFLRWDEASSRFVSNLRTQYPDD